MAFRPIAIFLIFFNKNKTKTKIVHEVCYVHSIIACILDVAIYFKLKPQLPHSGYRREDIPFPHPRCGLQTCAHYRGIQAAAGEMLADLLQEHKLELCQKFQQCKSILGRVEGSTAIGSLLVFLDHLSVQQALTSTFTDKVIHQICILDLKVDQSRS